MRVTYRGFFVQPSMRHRVERLESAVVRKPQVDCPIRHYFAPGLYAREISIPAGTVVTGAVHKTENLICVSLGRLRIVTNDGTRDVSAGETLVCKSGMKNAVYALEDSRWTNFMANPSNETDVEKLVGVYTESKSSDLLGGSGNAQLLAQAELKKVEA
jgi:quercetin dioxygenase-like cupin family protein